MRSILPIERQCRHVLMLMKSRRTDLIPLQCRVASTASKKLQIHSVPPSDTSHTWVGPADADSNLRPVNFRVLPNETRLEKDFRRLQEDTQEWNQAYWASHNRNFFMQKEAYIKKRLKELGPRNEDGSPRKLSAEDLSQFYAKFLNDNYQMHRDYNKEWYKKNISMLWPEFKVAIRRLLVR